MSIVELSLYGEATLKQEFSIIPPTNNWIPEYVIDYKKKCCDNCAFFSPIDERYEDGFCMKNVTNELSGQYILGSDTFYCSYHKFKV